MYDKLVKSLRICADGEHCDQCAKWDIKQSGGRNACEYSICTEAADTIEELQQYAELYKDGGEAVKKAAETYKAAYIAEHDARVTELQHWISVTERLPESGGSYIVYLRPFKGNTDLGFTLGDLSYATEMYFDKGQMLWVGENESYNAVLSVVNTETEYHITHWMPLPEPPKEET